MKKIEIFDTTLRDGAQAESVSFSVQDKLNIVIALDNFGVDFIEAGNPFSNPKDTEFFEKAKNLDLKTAKLCAFGSTCRKNTAAADDKGLQTLVSAGTEWVVIFGKAWDLHIKDVLSTTAAENMRMIADSISFLRTQKKRVIFDAEHFFDGFKADQNTALDILKCAFSAGAERIVLCDTNGGTLPTEILKIVETVKKQLPDAEIGIHAHNDTGCAVANSLVAVSSGAVHVQGTFLGMGERCGNADLSVVIPNLKLKMGMQNVSGNLPQLTPTALRISEICNLSLPGNKPYTGASAFAHKAGMHADGVDKCRMSFEHTSPKNVGNKRRFLLSEVGGKSLVTSKIAQLAPELAADRGELDAILVKLKNMEHQGYQFESADASFELLVMNVLGKFKPHFSLKMYKTNGEYPSPDGDQNAYAVVKVGVGDLDETSAALGNGPVNALDLALRKALLTFYPEIKNVYLSDYKVRVLSGADATGAKVRVLIESTDKKRVWTTVGVSTDIIEASWIALVDSIEYFLHKTDGGNWQS